MADNFLGEIRVFSFDFAPNGWAECNGQTLPIPQNQRLFSIIGNRFGGDGKANFALPNLKDSTVISQGKGENLSPYGVGDKGGVFEVILTEREMAIHTHQGQATTEPADVQAPGPDRSLARSTPGYAYQGEISQDLVRMNPQSTTPVGSNGAHNNMPPAQVLRFCIALVGEAPQPGSEDQEKTAS